MNYSYITFNSTTCKEGIGFPPQAIKESQCIRGIWKTSVHQKCGNHLLLLRSDKNGRHHVHHYWGVNDYFATFKVLFVKERDSHVFLVTWLKRHVTWESSFNTVTMYPLLEQVYFLHTVVAKCAMNKSTSVELSALHK